MFENCLRSVEALTQYELWNTQYEFLSQVHF
jgi:hypothetical protein